MANRLSRDAKRCDRPRARTDFLQGATEIVSQQEHKNTREKNKKIHAAQNMNLHGMYKDSAIPEEQVGLPKKSAFTHS